MSIPTKMALSGFIATDPDLHFTADGTAYCRLRVGVEQWRKETDGTFTALEPTFHDMVSFDATAREIYARFRPGDSLSTTLENEAIATVENEATQTDWMGDLSGGLGFDPAAGCGRCSAAAGRTGSGDRQGHGRAGARLGPATEVRAAGRADCVHPVRVVGEATAREDTGYAGDGDRRAGRLDRVDHVVS